MVFKGIFVLFALFIISCGVTHIFDIITIYNPVYWSDGIAKAITASASVTTAVVCIKLVPEALKIPSAKELADVNAQLEDNLVQLEDNIGMRQKVEATLNDLNASLEDKVEERTLEARTVAKKLEEANRELKLKQQRINQLNSEFSTMLNATPQMVWSVDANDKASFFNEQWINYTGVTVEDYNNDHMVEPIHPDDRELSQEHWQESLATGAEYEVEYRLKNKDTGLYRWYLVRGLPVLDNENKIYKWYGTCTDIHESKLRQNELASLQEELERRVKLRTAELQAANEELEETNEELERFAYVASHDLKEPIRMVSLYTELLFESLKVEDPDAIEYKGYILEGVFRMEELIGDILDYSRVGRVEEDSTWLEGKQVVDKVLTNLKRTISMSSAEVHIQSELPCMYGTENQYVRLLQNLIDNAIKFKHPDATPEVWVSAQPAPEKGFYKFTVRDNGIGINPQYLDKIFIIFQRLHNKKDYSGTGIGLAICKKIVELTEGKIWVESEEGKGSSFHFILPAKGEC